MKKNEPLNIRPVGNGFIVEPLRYQDMVNLDSNILVFDDYEDMVEFVSGHFDRVKEYEQCYENQLAR